MPLNCFSSVALSKIELDWQSLPFNSLNFLPPCSEQVKIGKMNALLGFRSKCSEANVIVLREKISGWHFFFF